MQVNIQNNAEITLKIMHGQITTELKCNLTEIIENRLIEFANKNKLDYKSIYFLYSGSVLYPTQLKKPISEIINREDTKDKIMTLLSYQVESNNAQEDEIIIILSIESVKIIELTDKIGEKIKDILKKSIKLDLNWCIFKYKNNEIDLEQKFDDIANDEDKKLKLLVLIVNYTIPLIVNFIYGKKKHSIQCLLGDKINDMIEKYFEEKHLDSDDYDLFYENKEIECYKKFYEIISEDKIQNSFQDDNVDNITVKSFPSSETIDELSKNKFNVKEKKIAPPIKEITKREISIEFKVIQKDCSIRYKRKLSNCLDSLKSCLPDCLKNLANIISCSICLFITLGLFFGFWFF